MSSVENGDYEAGYHRFKVTKVDCGGERDHEYETNIKRYSQREDDDGLRFFQIVLIPSEGKGYIPKEILLEIP